MFSKSHPIIIFLDRSGFRIFQDSLTSIPVFNFTPDTAANLEVVNKDQLLKLIASFIQINHISPSSIGFILSEDVIFGKDLTGNSGNSLIIQNFLENIPFEEVLTKVVKVNQKEFIFAVNQNLIMAIAEGFTSKGSILEVVIPSFLYGFSINHTQAISQENIKLILENTDIVKIGNLLTDQRNLMMNYPKEQKLTSAQNGIKKPNNIRQYVLVGIFIVLLVVLIFVFINSGK